MTATPPTTVLFVCRHGAAKSVLAAELARIEAARRGVAIDAIPRGLEPDAQRSPSLALALPEAAGSVEGRPERVTAAELRGAGTVVTFDLEPDELPVEVPARRWDGLPAVSLDPHGARSAIQVRVSSLIDQLIEA